MHRSNHKAARATADATRPGRLGPRSIAIGVVTLVTVGVLGGCASSDGGAGEDEIVLTGSVWSDWQFIQSAGEEFKKTHPNVTVKLNAISDGSYYSKIPELFASSDTPDFSAVGYDSSWIPNYVEAGVLEPLDDVWEATDMAAHTTEAFQSAYTFDDQKWGINVGGVVIPVVYYNKELFEKAGIADVDSSSMTMDDFYDIVDKLKAAGIGVLSTGVGDGTAAFRYFAPYFSNLCGDDWVAKISTGDTSGWSDPCVEQAMEVVDQWRERGVFEGGDAVTTSTSAIAQSTFFAGQSAMEMEGTWAVSALEKGGAGMDIGWFFLPSATDEPLLPALSSIDALVVSKNSKHVKETKEFLEFLATYDRVWEHGINVRDDVPAPDDTAPMLIDIADAVNESGPSQDLQQVSKADFVTAANNAIVAVITGQQTPTEAAAAIGKAAS